LHELRKKAETVIAPVGTFIVYRLSDGSIEVMEVVLGNVTIYTEPHWPFERRRITVEGELVTSRRYNPGETPTYEAAPRAEIEQAKLALDSEQGI
jgi:hypothetical protein